MEYVELGDTDERVSRLGFGGAPAGLTDYLGEYDPTDPAARGQVVDAIETALDCGITYFDTAPAYGDGTSEEIFGEALEGEDVFLATKVEIGDPDSVRARVEGSLDRLRRDRVDLLQIHGDRYSSADVDAVLDGDTLAEMQALRDDGLVRYLGFTTEDVNPGAHRLRDSGAFDVVQANYNLMFQHPTNPITDGGFLTDADERGMGTVTMRTTTSGIFQRWVDAVNPDDDFDYTDALVQYVLSNPAVDVALVGMRDPDIVKHNAALVDDTDGRVDLEWLFDRYE